MSKRLKRTWLLPEPLGVQRSLIRIQRRQVVFAGLAVAALSAAVWVLTPDREPPSDRQHAQVVHVEPPPPVPANTPPLDIPSSQPATASPLDRPASGTVVWVQAGHEAPREPGYRAQTGAGSGPFGSEVAFTTRLSREVARRLRSMGVDARQTPGLVTPASAEGAVFISLHHDSPDGALRIGHAITGAGENYYHGEGEGTASPVPYADSSPHREATAVSPEVEHASKRLANDVANRLQTIFTRANGARSRFGGVESRRGNPRMMRYYGYYRTRTAARVLVEDGAGGVDDAFLRRVPLIAEAISDGVIDYLGRDIDER